MLAKGLSLLELLVALLIGSILLVGVLAVTASTMKASALNLRQQRLLYEMQNAMDMMVSDIRRAGYWSNASSQIHTGTNSNPFMTTTNISVPTSSCILLGYDLNKDGNIAAANTSPDDERYGFRLSGNAIQGRISNTTYSCTSTTGWINITDPNSIIISTLIFNLSTPSTTIGTGPSTLTERKVDITMTGYLANDSNISATLTQTVRVFNDYYSP